MRKIIVKTKQPSNTIFVDDDDYDELIKFNWHIKKSYKTFYACRWELVNGKRKRIYLHRFITNNNYPIVDHIDRNGLNNQRYNLRNATHSENMMNVSVKKNNKVGHKGVHFSKERKKYVAQIVINGKNIPLGRYQNINDAISAYNNAHIQYRGQTI